MRREIQAIVVVVGIAMIGTTGCAHGPNARPYGRGVQQSGDADGRMAQMQAELEQARSAKRQAEEALYQVDEERRRLLEAQRRLQSELGDELADARAKLEMTERGLVITLLNRVLFDSGRAELRDDGLQVLDKVVGVIQEKLDEEQIAIEGHTDNVPITHSKWKSNWELSAARSLSVLHHMVDSGVPPSRLRSVGYGEFHPVASNDTEDGRQTNRRVEIVILPRQVERVDTPEPSLIK